MKALFICIRVLEYLMQPYLNNKVTFDMTLLGHWKTYSNISFNFTFAFQDGK